MMTDLFKELRPLYKEKILKVKKLRGEAALTHNILAGLFHSALGGAHLSQHEKGAI